jgi:hypothetical protein
MRIARLIFAGSLAALAVMAGPALAKKSEPPKADEDKPVASSSCHTYQPAADGTWTELPCQEVGGETQHRPPPKSAEEQPH